MGREINNGARGDSPDAPLKVDTSLWRWYGRIMGWCHQAV